MSFSIDLLKNDKKTKKAKQVFIVGQKGSGKSFGVKEIIKNFPGVVFVFDVQDEYANLGEHVHRYIPQDYGDLPGEFDTFLEHLVFKNEDKIDLVVAEELALVMANGEALSPQKKEMLALSRHKGITFLGVAQRPAQVNTTFVSLSDYTLSFKLQDKNDIARLSGISCDLAEAVKSLNPEEHKFAFWNGVEVSIEKMGASKEKKVKQKKEIQKEESSQKKIVETIQPFPKETYEQKERREAEERLNALEGKA